MSDRAPPSSPDATADVTTDAGRFAHIDALRGLAALAVAFFHFFGTLADKTAAASPPVHLLNEIIVEWLDLGRSAVLLFFIISGYVVARSVCSATNHHVARFAIRRLFRLYPLYWAALALCVLWDGPYGTLDIWHNLTMIQVPGWPHRPIVSVAWTMTVEIVFYTACVCLFLLGILQRPAGLAAVVALFLGVAVFAALGQRVLGFHIPFEWPLFLSLMFAGALLRELDERGITRRGAVFAIALLGYLPIVLGLSLLMFWDEAVHQKTWYRHFNAYAAAILVFLTVHYVYRLRLHLLSYLGRISYSIYLLHGTVGSMVIAWLDYSGMGEHLGLPLCMAAVLIATVCVSALTYHGIEAPFIGLSQRLARAIGRTPAIGQRIVIGGDTNIGS